MATAQPTSAGTGNRPVGTLQTGSHSERRLGSAAKVALENPGTGVRIQARKSHNEAGLPGLCRQAEEGREVAFHNQDRAGSAKGLPQVALWQGCSDYHGPRSFQAERAVPDEGGSRQASSEHKDAACSAVRNAGAGDGREDERYSRLDVGPRGFRGWHDRLPASGPKRNEQTPGDSANEPQGSGGTGRGAEGRSNRSCDRIWREAGKEHQTSHRGGGEALRRSMLAACVSAYSWSVDGSGRRADAEDRAVPGTHINEDHGDRVCPIFSPVHGRCSERFGLVAGSLVPVEPLGRIGRNGWKLRWAVTGSNRRPSRCKSEPPPPNRHFLDNFKERHAKLSLLAQARGGTK